MTEKNPTILFACLALIVAIGSWALNPIEAGSLIFADQFSFWNIPNGKNTLSCISLIILGIYGLTCRPRFDLGREVLVSLALACVSSVFLGAFAIWHHIDPYLLSRWAVHLALALCIMNAGFALVIIQLPIKSPWWLFVVCQLIAIFNASFEYVYDDRRFLLMSQTLLALLVLFSIIRLWRLSSAKLLSYSLALFLLAFVSNFFDQKILQGSAYMISGHSLQHLLWSFAGFFLLRFLIIIKPSDLNTYPTEIE